MKKSAKKSAKKAAKPVKSRRPEAGKLKQAVSKKPAPKKAAPKKTASKKAVKKVVKKATKPAPKKAAKKAVKTAPKKAAPKAAKPAPKAKPASKPAAKVGKVAAPATSVKAKNVSQAKAVVVSSMPAQSAVKAPKPAQSKHRQLQAPDTSGRKRLNKEELRFFENLLNAKKETLIQELDYIEDNAMRLNSKDGAGDLSSHAYHLADHATETQDREQAFHLASREGRFLYYIEEALDRVRAGTFGICKRCGTLIPKARLEAVPTAKMCINCKSQQEQIVEGE